MGALGAKFWGNSLAIKGVKDIDIDIVSRTAWIRILDFLSHQRLAQDGINPNM